LVRALSDSFGTMNASCAVLPFGTLGGSIVTCAAAGTANRTVAAVAIAPATIARRIMLAHCSYLMGTVV
jgi:hypothetical protein